MSTDHSNHQTKPPDTAMYTLKKAQESGADAYATVNKGQLRRAYELWQRELPEV